VHRWTGHELEAHWYTRRELAGVLAGPGAWPTVTKKPPITLKRRSCRVSVPVHPAPSSKSRSPDTHSHPGFPVLPAPARPPGLPLPHSHGHKCRRVREGGPVPHVRKSAGKKGGGRGGKGALTFPLDPYTRGCGTRLSSGLRPEPRWRDSCMPLEGAQEGAAGTGTRWVESCSGMGRAAQRALAWPRRHRRAARKPGSRREPGARTQVEGCRAELPLSFFISLTSGSLQEPEGPTLGVTRGGPSPSSPVAP